MSPFRRYRLITAIVTLCALLLSQVALAAYACPGPAKALEVVKMAEAAMPCAESMALVMDQEQPGLCHAHCEASQLSSDHYQVPALANLTQMGVVLTLAATGQATVLHELQTPLMRREAGPPLAVRHCCFRI